MEQSGIHTDITGLIQKSPPVSPHIVFCQFGSKIEANMKIYRAQLMQHRIQPARVLMVMMFTHHTILPAFSYLQTIFC
jgi:hypothetical protein